MGKPIIMNETRTPLRGQGVAIEYPLPVLETYDAIERLLVETEDKPLVESNHAISDALLHILNNLYQTNTENE